MLTSELNLNNIENLSNSAHAAIKVSNKPFTIQPFISTLLIYPNCFVTPTDAAPNSFFRNYQPFFIFNFSIQYHP